MIFTLKHADLLNGIVPFFRGTQGLSIAFYSKIKGSEKAFSCVEKKAISHFAVKFVQRSGHHFSAYSMDDLV